MRSESYPGSFGPVAELRLLGDVELAGPDGALDAGDHDAHLLLAFAALHANDVVSEADIAHVLGTGAGSSRVVETIDRVRQLVTHADPKGSTISLDPRPQGWTLRASDDALDVARVARLLAIGRAVADSGDSAGAALTLAEACRLWRGPSLGDVTDAPWAAVEAEHLDTLHRQVVEERMRALHHCGRDAEALAVFDDLARQPGMEALVSPGSSLAALRDAIRQRDPDLDAGIHSAHATTSAAPPPPPSAITAAPTSVEHEAGIVTLLFTDIVGSTEMLGRLGDDRYEQARRAHFRLLRDAVTDCGGAEVKTLGDGLMAVFASSVDALTAAATMQRSLTRHNRRADDNAFEVRIGLHVGEPIRDEDDYFGTPVVIAKRLCDSAEGGQIRASRLVADFVGSRGHFDFEDLGPVDLKGIGPTPACLLAWTDEPTRPMPAPFASLAERGFVGRANELAAIKAAWQRVQDGHPAVVLLAGEPGIGKTTLAVQMASNAWAEGAIALFGRCDEESLVAFQPFVEAIGHYADTTSPGVLRTQLGTQVADLALLLPGLGRRLPEVAGVEGTGAETERFRLFEVVPVLLKEVGDEAPVVMVLDDLHWADRPTLQLLQHLIRRAGDTPLLIVATYRDTDMSRDHPMADLIAELRRSSEVSRVPLRGLTRDEVVAMVAPHGDAGPNDTALGEALWAETEGSPLFLREVLRNLAEMGVVERDDRGGWTAKKRLDRLGIPDGVRDVIGRRLARLSDTCKAALRWASVLGREMRLDVVEVVSGIRTDDLLDALDEATSAGVIVESTGAAGRWAFTHALVRQTLYDDLSDTRKARMHGLVGEALETMPGADGSSLSELAYHFTLHATMGDAEKAIVYSSRAGEHSLKLGAFEEAARHFATAYDVATQMQEDSSRRADLLLAQGDAEWRAGDAGVARATFDRAVELIGESDAERLARVALGYAGAGVRGFWIEIGVSSERAIGLLETALDALPSGDDPLRARVLGCLARELYFEAGTEDRRQSLSMEAVAMGRRIEDPTTLAFVLNARILATMGASNPRERVKDATEIVEIAANLGNDHMKTFGYSQRLVPAFDLDEIRSVTDDLDRIDAILQGIKDPITGKLVSYMRAAEAVSEGRFSDAEALLIEGFKRGEMAHDRNSFAQFAMIIMWMRYLQGRTAEVLSFIPEMTAQFPGIQGLPESVAAWLGSAAGLEAEARAALVGTDFADPAQLPRGFYWTYAVSLFGIASDKLGDADAAARVYDLLLPLDGQNAATLTLTTGPVSTTLARTAARTGRLDAAERHFDDALAACAAHSWRALGADVSTRYAAMLFDRDRGSDHERAVALAREARSTAVELGMRTVLADASGLLGIEDATAAADRPSRSGTPLAPTISRRDRARSRLTARGRASVARWTRNTTDADLSRHFASNLAQRALFTAMAKSYQPVLAFGFEGDIAFELRADDSRGNNGLDAATSDWWTLQVAGRRASARRGGSDSAAVTVHVGVADFVRIVAGELHPIRALVEVRVEIEGDVVLAARLSEMFGSVEPAAGLIA